MRSWPHLQLPMWPKSTIDRRKNRKKAAPPRTTTRRSNLHPRLIAVARTAARWSSSRRGRLPWRRPRVELEQEPATTPMGRKLSGIHTRRQRSECWLRLSRMTMEMMKWCGCWSSRAPPKSPKSRQPKTTPLSSTSMPCPRQATSAHLITTTITTLHPYRRSSSLSRPVRLRTNPSITSCEGRAQTSFTTLISSLAIHWCMISSYSSTTMKKSGMSPPLKTPPLGTDSTKWRTHLRPVAQDQRRAISTMCLTVRETLASKAGPVIISCHMKLTSTQAFFQIASMKSWVQSISLKQMAVTSLVGRMCVRSHHSLTTSTWVAKERITRTLWSFKPAHRHRATLSRLRQTTLKWQIPLWIGTSRTLERQTSRLRKRYLTGKQLTTFRSSKRNKSSLRKRQSSC